jgi:hypothetical protein
MKIKVPCACRDIIVIPCRPNDYRGRLVGRNIMSIAHRSSAGSFARVNQRRAPLAAFWNIGRTTGACSESGRLTCSS